MIYAWENMKYMAVVLQFVALSLLDNPQISGNATIGPS